MLPSERRDVLDHVGRRRNTFAIELSKRWFEIERIPVDDGVDEQVQPGRPVELALEGPVRSSPSRLKNSARARVFWASLLLRPAVAFLRISGFCHHCGRKMDRLMRPISRKASASPFWRGNADSFASKVEGRTWPERIVVTRRRMSFQFALIRSTLTDSPMSEARFSGGVSPGKRWSRRSLRPRSRGTSWKPTR